MLSDNGTMCIVLPETVFHGTSLAYLREFIITRGSIVAIIELPHNTFRPHCNAKTCLLVLQKGVNIQDKDYVIMATPEEMGHDHNGKPLFRPNTDELWDDLAIVLEELNQPESTENKFVFCVPKTDIDPDVWVPRYYKGLLNPPSMPQDRIGVRIGEFLEKGIIEAWDGHGSPKAEYKGKGEIPYIRVADIVNWELYRNPVSSIPVDEYHRILGQKREPLEGDVILVRRGSYRIGTVAMVSPRDNKVLLTRELLTLRVVRQNNEFGITPFYLLAILASDIVQEQIPPNVFIDTTLPNLGTRWKNLILPIHKNKSDVNRISNLIEKSIKQKWNAQEIINKLRTEWGGLTT